MPIIPLPKTSMLSDVPAAVLDRNRRPTVDTSEQRAAVGQLGRSTQLPDVDARAFAAPYEALGAVGRAISEAGSIVGALAIKEQEAQTISQVSQADNVFTEHMGKFGAKLTTLDPGEWVAEFEKGVPQVRQQILADTKLTPEARERIALNFDRRSATSLAGIRRDAAEKKFSNAAAAILGNAENAMNAGDKPGFDAIVKDGVSNGFLPEWRVPMLNKDFAEAKERRELAVERKLYDDVLNGSVQVTKAEGLQAGIDFIEQAKLKPVDAERVRGSIKQVSNGIAAEAVDDLVSGIIEQRYTSEAHIAEVASWSKHVTPEIKDRMNKLLTQRSKAEVAEAEDHDQQVNGERNFAEMFNKIQAYDKTKFGSEEKALLAAYELRIESRRRVGSEDDGVLRSMLWQKAIGRAPDLTVPKTVRGYLDDAFKSTFDATTGVIPWKKKDEDGKETIDKSAEAAATKALWKAKEKAEIWMRTQPKDAQTIDKAIEMMETKFLPDSAREKAVEILRGVQSLPGSAATGDLLIPFPVKGAKVTSYGYAGDSTPDRNSAAGIGAFVPEAEQEKIKQGKESIYKLREGDIAVSPDVEKQLRASGVKPMDEILVKLANGETRRVRWADRTANDETAKKLGLSPLRGRFDFYSMSGLHKYDGMAVVGWQPI